MLNRLNKTTNFKNFYDQISIMTYLILQVVKIFIFIFKLYSINITSLLLFKLILKLERVEKIIKVKSNFNFTPFF